MLGFVKQGRTIPSAPATYTISLYVIDGDSISEYVSWDQESGVSTHSLRRIGEGRFTEKLQRDLPALPKASTCVLISSMGRRNPFFSLMEAGYAAVHIALQSYAIGMESGIVVMSVDQMKRVQQSLGLKDMPMVMMPVGRGA